MNLIKTLMSVAVCCSLLSGCELILPMQPVAVEKSQYDKLNELVADKSCDASYQCKVLEVGERPACEGPSRYIIYSSKQVNEQKIESIAASITAKEHAENQDKPTEDRCNQVIPVIPICIQNSCQPYTSKY
jgi:hypothetical protein